VGFRLTRILKKIEAEQSRGLTRGSISDNLKKFAQNTVARPVKEFLASRKAAPGDLLSTYSAIQFEDTRPRLCPVLVLDPKLLAQCECSPDL
jgi:hypothetical protein